MVAITPGDILLLASARSQDRVDSCATAMSLFLGFDSSTQSLKATAIDASDLQVGDDPI